MWACVGHEGASGAATMVPDHAWRRGFYQARKGYTAMEERAYQLFSRGKSLGPGAKSGSRSRAVLLLLEREVRASNERS